MRFSLAMSASAVAASVLLVPAWATPASADTVYQPAGTQWNGKDIYLSTAGHAGNDGVPGGACITNYGCDGFSENANSDKLATVTAIGSSEYSPLANSPLTYRGYRVRVGQGTLSQNVSNSNAWGADMHVPLHTNAQGTGGACGGTTDASKNGTMGLWYNANDKVCATNLVSKVGAASPGTHDVLSYRTNLGELKAAAPSCYLEAEFHTWMKGVTWLRDRNRWSYTVASAIDKYFGYVRSV